MLEVKDLHVSYGGIRALRGVNLEVPDGKIVTLIGANGAGKSTLLRTISGLVKAESGSITYDGKELLWSGIKHKDRDEISQAMSAALSAKTLISEIAGVNVYVHPVICAVGWYAKSTDLYGHPVLLTMEKTLKSTIPKVEARQQLSDIERNKIISAIKRSAQ